MDDEQRARKALLIQRNIRRNRIPAIRQAWRSHGVSTSALDNERCEQVIAWLRVKWQPPTQRITCLEQHLKAAIQGLDAVITLDFWRWDEAVALIIPSDGLLRVAPRINTIYPDGFLVVDRLMRRALLVDFDDEIDGAEIAEIMAS